MDVGLKPSGHATAALARSIAATSPVVVVVDDDPDVRAAIMALMESVGLESTGFASTRELLEADRPDRSGCLVLDVRMPGASGLDLQQQLAAKGDLRPVVFLTGHGDIPMSVQAMKAGAVDFLTKPVRDQTLLDAVTAALEQDSAQRARAQMIGEYVSRYATLTPRERQVMREVSLGRLNKQVAYDLQISEITVKLHRSSVMRKMQAASIGELIRIWEALPEDLHDMRRT
jgi:FixJ family two-component response regulator